MTVTPPIIENVSLPYIWGPSHTMDVPMVYGKFPGMLLASQLCKHI